MSYIIKGILSQKLPWGLVASRSLHSHSAGDGRYPSLAFAVGVYLPLDLGSNICWRDGAPGRGQVSAPQV